MKKPMPAVIGTSALLFVLLASIFASHVFLAQASTANFTSSSSLSRASSMSFTDTCPPTSDGEVRCLSLVSTTTVQLPLTADGTLASDAVAPASQPPYGPAALHKAYNLPTMAATQQTIAIIDAFDDPNAETDMNTYRKMFGIAPCTTADGCFTKVDQTGGTNFPPTNVNTSVEISLDLDMASAICENCHILLVEANTLTLPDLGIAENEAVALGANEVSNSFGGPENNGDFQACNQFFNHPGVVITASSGDTGSPDVEIPANCTNVVSVGGTTLDPNGTETAWNTSATEGTGGGCSALINIPPWQAQAVKQGKVITDCANRAVADVSAVADPATGVLVVDTFGRAGNGTLVAGGTSVSAPIIAGVYALAGGAPNAASGAILPWTKIAAGTNCLNVIGGAYAFQTGLGTPKGLACF